MVDWCQAAITRDCELIELTEQVQREIKKGMLY